MLFFILLLVYKAIICAPHLQRWKMIYNCYQNSEVKLHVNYQAV